MRQRKTDIFFFICGLFMLSGEIWKQLTLTFILGGGQYNWWHFPFQLCSIPMYILLIYPWIRRSALKQTLLTFLMCYGLLGGIAVFADTTGLHYPLPVLTAFSYGWHILLIVLGISAGTVYLRLLKGHQKKAPLRPFLYATGLYLTCCLAAVFLNTIFDRYGTINVIHRLHHPRRLPHFPPVERNFPPPAPLLNPFPSPRLHPAGHSPARSSGNHGLSPFSGE